MLDERQHLGDLAGIQRVAIAPRAETPGTASRYAAILNRDTPLRMPLAAWFSPSIT